ncbi:MAG TPA: MFS transporter [Alphaproteobacteria bacterium]|nr:MFS transporter [Alphaproteobacteria bacterium]
MSHKSMQTDETTTRAGPAAPALPPLSLAVSAIGVMTLAQIGSSISSQLVDLEIADLGGAFSLSSDDASWIACIATMAEVAAIPLAATLARAVTMRTLIIWTSAIFALAAIASLPVRDETVLLVLRAVGSFCGGTISVLMFTAVMANLPPGPGRSAGLSVFAFASTAPSSIAAWVGAVVTERFGWQGLFYFDIAWAVVLLVLAITVLRSTASGMRLAEIDWLGYALLAAGGAALTLFMKQGDRFFWLENTTIVGAGIVAAVVIPAAVCSFLIRRRPLIDLTLMKTTFGWAVTLATFYRFGMVMAAFVIPQALTRLQGFRITEIADANIWMFWAECASFPIAWYWASRWDARIPLSLGLALFAVGAYVSTYLTPAWQAADFRLTEIAIGFGQGLFLVPTIFYATRDVTPQQGPTAAALFNLSRVLGQTFGIAVVGSLITYQEKFHSAILVDYLSTGSTVAERFNELVASFLSTHGDLALAQRQAWSSLSSLASSQAYVLAFADAFVLVSAVLGVSALLVLMLPPLRATTKRGGQQPTAVHSFALRGPR